MSKTDNSALYTPIRDYSLIGNLRSVALVSRSGSIDWAPAPFIDSTPLFGALLDADVGGRWSIAPRAYERVSQQYIEGTNVLVTTFETKTGALSVTDFMPLEQGFDAAVRHEASTAYVIKRKVTCLRGRCDDIVVHFDPRFSFENAAISLEVLPGGVRFAGAKCSGWLNTSVTFGVDETGSSATLQLSEGESEYLVLTSGSKQDELSPVGTAHDLHDADLAATLTYWRAWIAACDIAPCPPTPVHWHGHLIRSQLLLKLLFFEPTGTVAAAPTTSLPEVLGGVRNWDYRMTWLRDSAFVFQAFFQLGHTKEAEHYLEWLVELCASLPDISDLQIVYGLRGQHELPELLVPHLDGYGGSKPVRVGNAAYLQKQWDVYGSVLDVVWRLHELAEQKLSIKPALWDVLTKLADRAAHVWREPDEGLWEVRLGSAHYVYSKVMCWVALDRALRLKEAYGLSQGDRELWSRERSAIYEAVHREGWNERKQSFVQRFGSDALDAALLLLPAVGFIDGKDPKMRSTIEAIRRELAAGPDLVYRYTTDDGLPGSEAPFLVASFWLVDALVHAGEHAQARERFEHLLTLCNHVGLYPEELDPDQHIFLGNFPQAYTHVGLINSALLLSKHAALSAGEVRQDLVESGDPISLSETK